MPPRRRFKLFASSLLCCGLLLFAPGSPAQSTSSTPVKSSATSKLVELLVVTQTDAERQALLQAAESLALTVGLRRELIAAGEVAKSGNDFTRSVAAYRSAKLLAERIGDREGIAVALFAEGNIHLLQGDQAAALALFRQSQAIDARVVQPTILARTLFSVGVGHFNRGNYDLAMQFYRESLDVYERNGASGEEIAGSVYAIGAIYYLQGDYVSALEYHQRVLQIAQKVGDPRTLEFAFFGLGADYRLKGDYAAALEFYGKSLMILERLDEKRDALVYRDTTTILRHIGTTYSLQGNYRLALSYYERCLQRDKAAKDTAGIANSLMYIGGVYRSQGRYNQALEYLNQALQSFESLGHQNEIAHTLNLIGSAYLLQDDLSRAHDYFERALGLYEKIAANEGVALTLVNLAAVDAARGDFKNSVARANRAAEISRRSKTPFALWTALLVLGKANRALQNPTAARLALDESIGVVESMRAHVAGGEENQELFFADKIAPYHEMVDLLVSENKSADAFAYAERARARVLLDVLHHGRSRALDSMSPAERERDKILKNELATRSAELEHERSRLSPDQTRVADFQARLERVRTEFATFQANVYVAHPELRLRRGETQAVSSQDLASLMPGNKTALIEYVVTDERTHLFVFTKAGANTQPELQIYPINVRRTELLSRVERFRRQLAQRDILFSANARALYELLLRPAAEQLRGKMQLVVVPDDGLWELPFQALQPTEDSYLIEQCAVFYAPSLAVLREMSRVRQRKARPAASQATLLLALGNPALGGRTIARANAGLIPADEEAALPALPEAEKQVRALARLYGPHRSQVYTGSKATEGRLKREAPSSRILHLATHGVLDNINPMYSYVMLSQDATNHSPGSERDMLREDGRLQAWELMEMSLDADLVVLSACETGRGEIKSGEGVIGLSWALFVAGSPTTVVSQWKVESASTTELMLEFHRHLYASLAAHSRSAGISKAEALRQASLALLRTDKYSHPFYWAGFIMMGDGN